MRLLGPFGLVLACIVICSAKVLNLDVDTDNPYYDGKKTELPISATHGVELMQHWLDQAFSGLMAAITTKKLARLKPELRRRVHECNKQAKTVAEHAKCSVKAIEFTENPANLIPETIGDKNSTLPLKKIEKSAELREVKLGKVKKMPKSTKPDFAKSMEKRKNRFSHLAKLTKLDAPQPTIRKVKKFRGKSSELREKRKRKKSSRRNSTSGSAEKQRKRRRRVRREVEEDDGLEEFYAHHRIEHHDDFHASLTRAKRAIHNRASYDLSHSSDRTPIGIISRHIATTIRHLKGKQDSDPKNWKTVLSEITEKARELKTRERMRKMLKKRAEFYQKAEKEGDQMDIDGRRALAMPELDALDEKWEKEEMLEMARDKMKNMTEEQKAMVGPMHLVRQAVKLGMTMAGKNVSDFEKKNVNLISPRIFSLVPENEERTKDEINLLSPSVFSLHQDGDDLEKSLSMGKALRTVGLDPDTQQLMDMIVEAAGVSDAVDSIKNSKFAELERKEEIRGPNGEPLFWTRENASLALGKEELKKIDVMEHLHKMYTPSQMEEMRATGYTTMTPRQLDFVYGPRSPYNNSETLDKFRGMKLGRAEVDEHIQNTIRDVALRKIEFKADPTEVHKELDAFKGSRKKDIVLSPISFLLALNNPALVSQPVILSPVIFSALVCSPAVFGAIILSPWLFVAAILSPRVLSPVILNPFGFVPIILTPLALDPIILSPGIFNPFVLSPLVLCPFILSPQAFTPLILSPLALNPFILTPNLMSPLILSPFVLSPIILSPAYVTGIILSPYALSPAIGSNGAIVTVFGSPSFLS